MAIPRIIFFAWKMFYWTFGLTLTLIVLPLLIFIKVIYSKHILLDGSSRALQLALELLNYINASSDTHFN